MTSAIRNPTSRIQTWLPDAVACGSLLMLVAIGLPGAIAGDRQPVGGDRTRYFFGLMSYYDDALSAGRLPLWNERWGFGFPALAESQTGVLYPPHLILYSLLAALDAYRWTDILHRLAACVLGYAAVRGLGLRPMGALVATLSYVLGGFALGHLEHQWAVLSLVWLPPILWTTDAWLVARSRKAFFLLAPLVACQLLIGHFQVAFMTLSAAVLYAGLRGWQLASIRQSAVGLAGWSLGISLGLGMAGAQLVPTYRLLEYLETIAPRGAGGDYFTTHALPPPMMVNWLFPWLYFREPLWRAVVWTPARAAPEECLLYIGLVPLALALGCIGRWRRSAFVYRWVAIFAIALWLSLGPFAGADRLTNWLPDFSRFRAPARWSLVSDFALAMLAGYAADHVRSTRRLWRWWRRFMLLVLVVGLLVAGAWGGLDFLARGGHAGPGWLDRAAGFLHPFDERPIQHTIDRAAAPQLWDAYTQDAWVRLRRPNQPRRLIDEWRTVFSGEILPTLGVIAWTTVVLGLASRFSRRNRWALVTVCAVDLVTFAFLAPDRSAPIAALKRAGPIYERMRSLPTGARVVGPGGSLLMAWDLAPLPGYRSLDAPLPLAVSHFLMALDQGAPPPAEMPVLLGIVAIVRHPWPMGREGADVADADPALDWWLAGSLADREWLQSQSGATLGTVIERIDRVPAAALVLAANSVRETSDDEFADPAGAGSLYPERHLAPAGSVRLLDREPQTRTWLVTASAPALLILGELYLPGWSAVVAGESAEPTINVGRFDGYWQAVRIAEAGVHTVTLRYDAPGLWTGVCLSLGSVLLWILLLGMSGTWRRASDAMRQDAASTCGAA